MSIKILDRVTAPGLQAFRKSQFPPIEQLTLDNGIPIYIIPFGSQELFEISILTRGGKSFENAQSEATFAAKMLLEGTTTRSGYEFAKKIDEFGALIHCDSGFESATFSLTSLSKFSGETISLLGEMLLSPAFDPQEYEKLINRTVQGMEVEEKKTRHQARKKYNRLLFGENHPYRGPSEISEIKALPLDQVRAFHQRNNSLANASIVISGKFNQAKVVAELNKTFGAPGLLDSTQFVSPATSKAAQIYPTPANGFHLVEMNDSLQATLRVGHAAFDIKHPDYYKMQVATTIFGGFFGSRLMKNIREDKGFTYGINASWAGMKHQGFFVIQTDIDNKNITQTLKEIRFEMERLMLDGVEEDELSLVRNYLMGRSFSHRETPSQMVELVAGALVNDIPFEKIDEAFDVIRDITPAEVKAVCQKWFKPENLLEVVAGKRS